MNRNNKYSVLYNVPGGGGSRRAVIDAPDIVAARNMAANMFGNVVGISRDFYSDPQPQPKSSYGTIGEGGVIQTLGRNMAHEHLGVIGDNISDDAMAGIILFVFSLPLIGPWVGIPAYRATLLSPAIGFPPLTLGIGAGIAAALIGWVVLYFCPVILLRVMGFLAYAGWFSFYMAGWIFDIDLLRNVTMKIITINTDQENLHKVGLVLAGLAGSSAVANLGKLIKGT